MSPGKRGLFFASSALLLGMLACAGGVEGPAPSAVPDVAPVSKARAAAPAERVMADDILGINEAVSIPAQILARQRPSPEQVKTWLREDAKAARAVGARWVRSHTAVYPNFSHHQFQAQGRGYAAMDVWVQVVQEEGLKPLIMLSPWSGNATGVETSEYVVADEAAYTAWVTAAVERYDGDGVDDMPGLLAPIRHWEVDNEPDLKNSLPPKAGANRYDPAKFCVPTQYARVLLMTSKAVKAADAGATVLNGGLYRPHTPQGAEYMRSLFKTPGVLDAVDAVSIHAYFSSKDVVALERAIDLAAEVAPGKPVWITETSVPAVDDKVPHVNETYQAQTLARMIALALQRGVAHVFWHSLNDPPIRPQGLNNFWSNSLYRAGATPNDPLTMKPAGYAYQALAQALAEVPRDEVVATAASVKMGSSTLVLDGKVTVDPDHHAVIRMGEQAPVKVTKVSSTSDGPTLVRPVAR